MVLGIGLVGYCVSKELEYVAPKGGILVKDVTAEPVGFERLCRGSLLLTLESDIRG